MAGTRGDAGPASQPGAPAHAGVGRPADHSRDDHVLAVTLDALAERDYDQVTLDSVALRAGRAKTTLYRRWPTKVDLVLAAVRAAGRPPEADALPDTGSLRSDLLAVVDSPWLGGPQRRLAVFAGLASAARSSARVADAVRSQVNEPYVEVYASLLRRAADRGLVAPGAAARIPMVARVVPAMADHRLGGGRQPVDRDFFASVVDDVVLPALGGPAPTGPDRARAEP